MAASPFDDPLFNISDGCTSIDMIQSRGVFYGTKPILQYSVPILLLQIVVSSLSIVLFSRLLKPLDMYSLVPQILGGMILGPTFLGRIGRLTEQIFPARSLTVLDTLALFGCMFYFFIIGVKADLWMLKKIRKREISIGMATFVLGLFVSVPIAAFASSRFQNTTGRSLINVAASGSFISFPVIAHYLDEVRLVNSEFGQVTLSTSASCYIFGFVVLTILSLTEHKPGKDFDVPKIYASGLGIGLVSILIVRPIIIWFLKKKQEGEALREDFIYIILVGIPISGFISESVGMNFFFGPLLYGFAIPSGPPLGSALIEKLEVINTWFLMPLFFLKVGLIIDLGSVTLKEYAVVQLVVFSAWTGKFVGATLGSIYFDLPFKDAVSIGLSVNVQGVLELGLFKIFLDLKALDEKAFTTMCTSMLLFSAITTPIIRYLQDPSRRYAVNKNQTIMHLDINSELRVLVCAHDQEDVASTLKFLEAINPTKRSPIAMYALHLIEHVGSAQPLLIPHKLTKTPSSKASASKSIVNALRYFEDMYHGVVSVHPFTSISTYANMHDEICRMALSKKTSLIIVPYHKRFVTVGVLEAFKKGIRKMNYNILEMAPCSVAVIVDRGILGNSRATFGSWNSYSVAVLFLGGPDDREALAIGTRMAGQPNINLTVICLVPHPSIAGLDDPIERKQDNQFLCQFRLDNAENERIMYIEEVVLDGTGTATAMRSMEDTQELIIVGRRHDKNSPLVMGLVGWDEETELGPLGDALVSPDFRGNSSVLVVQQHTYNTTDDFDGGDEIKSSHFSVLEDTYGEAEHLPIQKSPV